nr:GIY-YIG nuclease family protein [Methylobacterium haplocladii]
MTFDQPTARMMQLSTPTGIPMRFECAWSFPSANPRLDEKRLHAALQKNRLNGKREFFRCTPDFALAEAQRLGMTGDALSKPSPKRRMNYGPRAASLDIGQALAIALVFAVLTPISIIHCFGISWIYATATVIITYIAAVLIITLVEFIGVPPKNIATSQDGDEGAARPMRYPYQDKSETPVS